MADRHNNTPSRRNLFGLAAAGTAVAASALAGTPAGASPEITAAIAAYWGQPNIRDTSRKVGVTLGSGRYADGVAFPSTR